MVWPPAYLQHSALPLLCPILHPSASFGLDLDSSALAAAGAVLELAAPEREACVLLKARESIISLVASSVPDGRDLATTCWPLRRWRPLLRERQNHYPGAALQLAVWSPLQTLPDLGQHLELQRQLEKPVLLQLRQLLYQLVLQPLQVEA